MMIKKLVTITALAMLLGSPNSHASVSAVTGNELVEYCDTPEDGLLIGYCHGFVNGVSNLAVTAALVCPPGGVTEEQLVNIVRKSMKENPEMLHLNAVGLVTFAISKVFPCSE